MVICQDTSRSTLTQTGLDWYLALLFHSPDAEAHYQLSDVANGLSYLHSCNIIHGDVKGVWGYSRLCFSAAFTPEQANILVDDSCHARITDFGLAVVTKNLDSIPSASAHHGLTVRWAAPEVMEEGTHSKEADTFSFAMVMIEVCCD